MAEESCALCGGELVEEEIDSGREKKMRENSPHIEEGEEMHALVCQDCGHVTYHRS